MFKLYNTLSKNKSEIVKNVKLNMYSCGPTVYNYAHIGNLRSFILADLLYRALKYQDYNPKWVMNITDIDDKTIKGTIEKFGKNAGVKELFDFTENYLQAFKADLKEVNVLFNEIEFIRVTDKMKEIGEFINSLLEKGYAYKADDGVYFSIEKYQKDFGDYGDLVGKGFLEGKKIGARVAVDEYQKDNLSDFVLWKFWDEKTDAQIFWDLPSLGKGRPGWHIECSVINYLAFKGEITDIHTGGMDLMFPHHTNEIAQSQGLLGKGNFVKHWFHSEHLLVDGKKMSKSLGNFYTLKDIISKGFSGMDFRYTMFFASYRATQNFTWESLKSAHSALERLFSVISESDLESILQIVEQLKDDLNIPEALAEVWKKGITKENLENLFGIIMVEKKEVVLPEEVKNLLERRSIARENKNFKDADALRKQIEDMGYEILDTSTGQTIRKR